jgi:Polyketide cyclase / dehydrase and lipid transport
MSRQEVHIVVKSKASPSDIYRLLKDGRTWVDWSDLDECVPSGLAASGEEQVGTLRASRRGRTRGCDRVTELVPDHRLGYQNVNGLPVADYVASVDLTPGAEGTTITWDAAFTPRWAGTGAIIRRGVERFLGGCARGLAEYAETAGHGTHPPDSSVDGRHMQ